MSYQGDIIENQVLYWGFSTRDTSSFPTKLLGTPVGRVYKNDSVAQTTTGITINGFFDSVVGQVMVKVDTADAFYEKLKDYSVYLQDGTVDGGTVVGELVGTFSIENRFMRGTDSAATAANLATVDTVVDAIKVITDALPNSGALTDIGVNTAKLTDVRMAVLTDWINNGRLDILLDAIPTTAMRGTDGALTDKAGFSLSTAGILGIWHQLMSGIVTVDTVGKLIKDYLNAAVGSIPTTPMRGTDNAALATTAFNAATTNVNLAATGLDNIAIDEVTGPATKWREMIVQLWRAEFKKRVLHKLTDTTGTMSHRNDADSEDLLQAVYTEDSSDQTMDSAS